MHTRRKFGLMLFMMAGTMLIVTRGTALTAGGEDLPSDKCVRYAIHETPGAPKSRVTFHVEMDLGAVERMGNEVGWNINSISFRQLGYGGAPDRVWTIHDPTVPTSDGLWWVDHPDWQAVDGADFTAPPLLTGTASAHKISDPGLDFELEGNTDYDEPSPYNGAVAGMRYRLAETESSEPLEEVEEDEPVEIFEDLPS
ncbi:MAG: hypothetical protein ACYTHJ_10900 [Planctomycetota bacterium]